MRPLRPLRVGAVMRIQPLQKKLWKKAVVQKQLGFKSYMVRTPNKRVYRRNRRLLGGRERDRTEHNPVCDFPTVTSDPAETVTQESPRRHLDVDASGTENSSAPIGPTAAGLICHGLGELLYTPKSWITSTGNTVKRMLVGPVPAR